MQLATHITPKAAFLYIVRPKVVAHNAVFRDLVNALSQCVEQEPSAKWWEALPSAETLGPPCEVQDEEVKEGNQPDNLIVVHRKWHCNRGCSMVDMPEELIQVIGSFLLVHEVMNLLASSYSLYVTFTSSHNAWRTVAFESYAQSENMLQARRPDHLVLLETYPRRISLFPAVQHLKVWTHLPSFKLDCADLAGLLELIQVPEIWFTPLKMGFLSLFPGLTSLDLGEVEVFGHDLVRVLSNSGPRLVTLILGKCCAWSNAVGPNRGLRSWTRNALESTFPLASALPDLASTLQRLELLNNTHTFPIVVDALNRFSNLHHLDISRNSGALRKEDNDDEQVRMLELPLLTDLRLSGSQWGLSPLDHLISMHVLPNLQCLQIEFNDSVENIVVVSDCSRLERISLQGCSFLTDATPLTSCLLLTHIDLRFTSVKETSSLAALNRLTNLQHL